MIFKIKSNEDAARVHISTDWFLVNINQLETYDTTYISKETTTGDNKDIVNINVDDKTGLYIIAVRTFENGISDNIGPKPIDDNVPNGIFTMLSPVDTPILKLESNTWTVSGSGSVKISSSPIFPKESVLGAVSWTVIREDTGEVLDAFFDKTNYSLEISRRNGLRNGMKNITVYCVHQSKDGTCSKQGHLTFELNKNDIEVSIKDNLNPNIDNYVTIKANGSMLHGAKILILKDGKVVHNGERLIPANTLDYSSEYLLVADIKYGMFLQVTTKEYSFTTTENSHRSDVILTDEPIIKKLRMPTPARGFKSAMLMGNELMSGITVGGKNIPITSFYLKNIAMNKEEPLFIYENVKNTRMVNVSTPDGTVLEDAVEIIRYEDNWSFMNSYNKATKTMLYSVINMPRVNDTLIRAVAVPVTSQSSNMAILNSSEIYYIVDKKIHVIKDNVNIEVKDLPNASYDNSEVPFRIDFINGSELYIVTNTGAILLFNIISKEFDILNRFVPKEEFMTTVLSDGGLLIINGFKADEMKTIIYDRKKDTLTTGVSKYVGVITEINGAITKVTIT